MNTASRRHRPLTLARSLALLLALVVAIGGAALCGCGSSSDPASETSSGASEATDTSGTSDGELSSADEIGERIVGLYQDAMNDVVGLMEGLPDAASLRPEVEQLKEDYVQQMVAVGKQREQLSDADRTAVDMVVTEGLGAMSAESVFEDYIEGQAHYMSQDVDLANLLADFNILTQWADFELLRSQDPEEAERLGL